MRPRRVLSFASFAVLALLAEAVTARAQETTTLAYHWGVGDVIRQRVTTERTVEQGAGSLLGAIRQNDAVTYRMTVKKVSDDGAATLETVFESITSEKVLPTGARSKYDSARPRAGNNPQDLNSTFMDAMVNEPFTVVIGPDGVVRDIEVVKKVFRSDAVQRMMPSVAPLPPAPVKPGDAWDSAGVVTVPALGTMTAAVHSVFTGMEGRGPAALTRVASTWILSLEPANADDPENTLLRVNEGTLKGTRKDDTWFDSAKGRLRKSVMRTTMTRTVSSRAADKPVTMETTVTLTTTVEDLADAEQAK
jgi:hypothetical protein